MPTTSGQWTACSSSASADCTTVSSVTSDRRLFIFPHTGGSASFYVPFAKAFTPATKCVAVQYPGKRAGKDLSQYTSIPDLADKLCAMLKPAETPGDNLAFFGHSMGALLAFEVALRFEREGNPISALFVSASAAPGMWRRLVDMTESNDLQLLSMISDVTGANPEFLKDDQFAATLLPTLRGLKAITTYDCPPEATVSCPIHGLRAENDDLGTEELMAPWAQRTTATFDLTVFPGDHFYINTNLPQLSQWVEQRIVPTCAES